MTVARRPDVATRIDAAAGGSTEVDEVTIVDGSYGHRRTKGKGLSSLPDVVPGGSRTRIGPTRFRVHGARS